MSLHTPARPEPVSLPQNLTHLVNLALREAALAPTVFDALDVTGNALIRLAELARAEVRHGS